MRTFRRFVATTCLALLTGCTSSPARTTAAHFVAGVFISEVWFGWATERELQPNIDGLSFDEVLLGLVPGIGAVVVIKDLSRSRSHGSRLAH